MDKHSEVPMDENSEVPMDENSEVSTDTTSKPTKRKTIILKHDPPTYTSSPLTILHPKKGEKIVVECPDSEESEGNFIESEDSETGTEGDEKYETDCLYYNKPNGERSKKFSDLFINLLQDYTSSKKAKNTQKALDKKAVVHIIHKALSNVFGLVVEPLKDDSDKYVIHIKPDPFLFTNVSKLRAQTDLEEAFDFIRNYEKSLADLDEKLPTKEDEDKQKSPSQSTSSFSRSTYVQESRRLSNVTNIEEFFELLDEKEAAAVVTFCTHAIKKTAKQYSKQTSLRTSQTSTQTLPTTSQTSTHSSSKDTVTASDSDTTVETSHVDPVFKIPDIPKAKSISPEKKQLSPEKKQLSPEKKQLSPEKKQLSPKKKHLSPEKKHLSPTSKKHLSPTSEERPPSSPSSTKKSRKSKKSKKHSQEESTISKPTGSTEKPSQ